MLTESKKITFISSQNSLPMKVCIRKNIRSRDHEKKRRSRDHEDHEKKIRSRSLEDHEKTLDFRPALNFLVFFRDSVPKLHVISISLETNPHNVRLFTALHFLRQTISSAGERPMWKKNLKPSFIYMTILLLRVERRFSIFCFLLVTKKNCMRIQD
jgi:hypothetical protein